MGIIDGDEGLIETGTGITIENTFDYGDEEGEIYFTDKHGEICMWTMDEIREDPSVVAPIFNTIMLSFRLSSTELRQRCGRSCPTCCPDAPQREHCICEGLGEQDEGEEDEENEDNYDPDMMPF